MMREKLKLALLLLLIGLSLLQTYLLWFGRPLPEEGTQPRYEHVFFTELPAAGRLMQPLNILATEGETIYQFRRGESTFDFLWEKCFEYLKSALEGKIAQKIGEDEKERLEERADFKLDYFFTSPLPPELIVPDSQFNMEMEHLFMFWEGQNMSLLLSGVETYLFQFPAAGRQDIAGQLAVRAEDTYHILPPEMELYVYQPETADPEFTLVPAGVEPGRDGIETALPAGSARGELEPGSTVGTAAPRLEAGNGESASADEESPERADENENRQGGEFPGETALQGSPEMIWNFQVADRIVLPEGNLWAAEISLYPEVIDLDQLVRSFFVDPSMTRRIEERDRAIYFTDGQRGLRIYPTGRVEYTAPRLEHVQSRIKYHSALQKGAENLSLFGGWVSEAFLDQVESQPMGYRLTWQLFHDGLRFTGENVGAEMVINEQGAAYFQRKFPLLGETLFEKKPFRSYASALYEALRHNPDAFRDNRLTLLSLEPVYYISTAIAQSKAVPAWRIDFQETGPLYLHWQTLEKLE